MKLFLKIIGYTFLGFAGLLVLAFIVLQLITDEQYKKWITDAAGSATGRELAINGGFEVQIGRKLGLSASDITFANAQWGSRAEMVTADSVFVQLDVLPLFKGLLDVTIELDAPDILMEKNEAGQGNWVFATAETKPESEAEKVPEQKSPEEDGSFGLPIKPYIRNLEINDLKFAFNDQANSKEIEAQLEVLRIFVDGSDIPITLKAMYQDAPIVLEGSLGNLDDYYANKQTPFALTGALNEAVLGINGTAGPLMPEPNARIDLTLTADNIATFSQFAGMSLPDLKGLDISLTMLAEKGQLASKDIKVTLNDPRLLMDVNGAVANLSDVTGIDFKAELNSEYAAELMKELDLQIPYSLPPEVRFTAGVQGDMESLSVHDLELVIRDQGLDVSLTGSLENVLEPAGVQADLVVNLDSTTIIGNYIGQDLPAFGPFEASAKLSSIDKKIQLETLQIDLSDPAVSAHINGKAESIGRSSQDEFEITGIEINAEAGSEHLADIMDKIGVEIPVEMPASFSLKSTAAGSLEQLAIKSLEAVVKDEGVDVNLTGSVANIIKLSGVEGNIQALVHDTANLSKFAGIELPSLGSLNLQGQVVSEGETYRLNSLELDLDGEAVKAQIHAAIKDLLALASIAEKPESSGAAGIDASFNVDTSSVAELVRAASLEIVEIPEIGALQFEGHLGSSEQSLALDAFNAVLTRDGVETKAAVTIQDVIALSGVQANIDGHLDSLSVLADFTDAELPETGPWTLSVKADSDNPLSSPIDFSAELDGEGINAVVNADIPDINAPQTFQTQLNVDVESIVRIAALLGRELPEDRPLKVNGNASGKPGEYRINEFKIESGESELLADLAYIDPPEGSNERKNLSGKMTISNFDFNAKLAAVESEAESSAEEIEPTIETEETEEKEPAVETEETKVEEEKPTTGKKLFPSDPISVGILHDYDIDLKVAVTNITIPGAVTLDGDLAVLLDQGLLTIDPFKIDQSNGGTGVGQLTLDARSPEANLDLDIDFENFVSPRFGGEFDLNVDLVGKGESVAALMGSLNGHFVAALNGVELEKSFMSKYGAGLLSNINPLGSDKTLLECAIIRFDIEDGLANFHKKIAAQTTEVTWLGGGEINLKTEELDVGIAPSPRGALSSMTNVGLASLVHVGGTLAEPKVGIDVTDVAKKYAGYSAFIATGGLSFLAQKLVETAQANVDQCERILEDLE